jgi:hypothetical protein
VQSECEKDLSIIILQLGNQMQNMEDALKDLPEGLDQLNRWKLIISQAIQ